MRTGSFQRPGATAWWHACIQDGPAAIFRALGPASAKGGALQVLACRGGPSRYRKHCGSTTSGPASQDRGRRRGPLSPDLMLWWM